MRRLEEKPLLPGSFPQGVALHPSLPVEHPRPPTPPGGGRLEKTVFEATGALFLVGQPHSGPGRPSEGAGGGNSPGAEGVFQNGSSWLKSKC